MAATVRNVALDAGFQRGETVSKTVDPMLVELIRVLKGRLASWPATWKSRACVLLMVAHCARRCETLAEIPVIRDILPQV